MPGTSRGPGEGHWVLILVALGGLGLAGYGAFEAARWTLARGWPVVPCVVEESTVKVRDDPQRPYVARIAYRYEWGGRTYRSDVYSREHQGGWDIAEADRLARAFPVGARRTCRVNPREPSVAQLALDNPLLPLAIAVGASSGAAFLLLVGRHPRSPWVERIGSIFLAVMGLAGFGLFFGQPIARGIAARGWRATPCEVEASEVRVKPRSGLLSTSVAWPDVVVRYEVGGRSYRANTFNPTDVGSPWRDGARRIARRFRPGMEATCYVDPRDPSRATLTRHASGTLWYGLWPLVMAGMGIGGAIVTRRGASTLPRTLRPGLGTFDRLGLAFALLTLWCYRDGTTPGPNGPAVQPPAWLVTGIAASVVLALAYARLRCGSAGVVVIDATRRGVFLPDLFDGEVDGPELLRIAR